MTGWEWLQGIGGPSAPREPMSAEDEDRLVDAPNPAVWASVTEPEVIEPDQEPDDDTEAELPDVREDPVPE